MPTLVSRIDNDKHGTHLLPRVVFAVFVSSLACCGSPPPNFLRISDAPLRRQALSIAFGGLYPSALQLPVDSVTEVLPARRCIAYYQGGGCALNVRLPASWSELPSSMSLRGDLKTVRFALPTRKTATVADNAPPKAVVEIRYASVGPPPPRLRGARGEARLRQVEDWLGSWEAQFPAANRTRHAQSSGKFSVGAGEAVKLVLAGSWAQEGAPPEELVPACALLAAVLPAKLAEEGERQYAFFVSALGSEQDVLPAEVYFSAFIRSAQTDDKFFF